MDIRKDRGLLLLDGSVTSASVVNGENDPQRLSILFSDVTDDVQEYRNPSPGRNSCRLVSLDHIDLNTARKLRDELTEVITEIEQQPAADRMIAEFAEGTPLGVIADKLAEAGFKAAAESYYRQLTAS